VNADPILSLLPWRHPFLMIDRMIECAPEESIVTQKNVSAGDAVAGAAGSGPWFPGMLMLEGLGQTAALLFRLSRCGRNGTQLPMLGFMKADLRGSAAPGQAIRYEVRSLKMTGEGGVFEGRALLEGRVIAEAELAFASRRGQAPKDREGLAG
jgi:3-hydroxyacyl-[acyl-carrier-protein] dehydratase